MTTTAVTTRLSVAKAPWPTSVEDDSPTLIHQTFDSLTKAVDEALEHERDLSHAMSWDPTSTDIQEAAEACWQDCLQLSGDIMTAKVVSASDLPFQRMSMLLHFLIEASGPEEALQFQQLYFENQELFSVEDAVRRPLMQTAARQMDALVELSLAAEAQNFLPI